MATKAEQRSIIIVDDDANNAYVLELLFAAETDFQTLTYSSGEQTLGALDAISWSHPALFVIDHYLLHLSGFDLCKMLHGMEPFKHTPFILVTGLVEDAFIKEADRQGFYLVHKPYDIDVFLSAVKQYTDSPAY